MGSERGPEKTVGEEGRKRGRPKCRSARSRPCGSDPLRRVSTKAIATHDCFIIKCDYTIKKFFTRIRSSEKSYRRR